MVTAISCLLSEDHEAIPDNSSRKYLDKTSSNREHVYQVPEKQLKRDDIKLKIKRGVGLGVGVLGEAGQMPKHD